MTEETKRPKFIIMANEAHTLTIHPDYRKLDADGRGIVVPGLNARWGHKPVNFFHSEIHGVDWSDEDLKALEKKCRQRGEPMYKFVTEADYEKRKDGPGKYRNEARPPVEEEAGYEPLPTSKKPTTSKGVRSAKDLNPKG